MTPSDESLDRAAAFAVALEEPKTASAELLRELPDFLASEQNRTALEETRKLIAQLRGIDPDLRIDVDGLIPEAPRRILPWPKGADIRRRDSTLSGEPTSKARIPGPMATLLAAVGANFRARPRQDDADVEDNSPPTTPLIRGAINRGAAHLRRLSASLAGYDLQLLPRYADQAEEHERKKLVRIGASVAIPATLGFLTVFFFLGPYVESLHIRLFVALGSALLLLGVDSIIVSTLARSSWLGILLRISISVCLSAVIAEPLIMSLYQKSIDAEMTKLLRSDADRRRLEYEFALRDAETTLNASVNTLAKLQERSKDYSPSNIALVRFRERLAQKDQALDEIRKRQSQDVERMRSARKELLKTRQQLQEEIEQKRTGMAQEMSGQRGGAPGKGVAYRVLGAQMQSIAKQSQKIDEEISAIDAQIAALLLDQARFEPGPVNIGASGPADESISLTAGEEAEKARIDGEIAAMQSSIASTRLRRQQIQKGLEGIPEEFSLSKNDDSLLQARALREILATDAMLKVKVAALFMLLFLIDMSPVLIKLTVRTGYDEYMNALWAKRIAEAATKMNEAHRQLLRIAQERIERLCEYMDGPVDKLKKSIGGKNTQAIKLSIATAVQQHTEEMLSLDRKIELWTGRVPTFAGLSPTRVRVTKDETLSEGAGEAMEGSNSRVDKRTVNSGRRV